MRGRLTYANVMSTLAVFLALAGGSFAIGAALSKNSVKSKQVKNESLTDQDLKDGSAVGSAEVRDDTLGSQDLGSASVGSAELATGAVGSGAIADGSVGAADLAPQESFHLVGAGGEPTLSNGGEGDCLWSDYASAQPAAQPLSFFRDRDGIVHLGGTATAANGGGGDAQCNAPNPAEYIEDHTVFTLPPAYRPSRVVQMSTVTNNATPLLLVVGADHDATLEGTTIPAGAVIAPILTAPAKVALDGLTFRVN